MNTVSLLFVFLEGLLTFMSPCILPLLPVYFAYLAGSPSSSRPQEQEDGKKKLLINSIGFVIGFSLVFTIMGATATTLGQLLLEYEMYLRKASGIIMIIFGFLLMGVLRLKYLETQLQFNFVPENLKFTGSILFGSIFAFSWSPCAGPLLGSALLLAGSSKTVFSGILLLLVYSLGLAIPFILSALLIERANRLLGWIKKKQQYINIVSGLILIAAGLLIYFNKLVYLNSLLY